MTAVPLLAMLLFSPTPEPESWRWNLPDWCRSAVERSEKQMRVTLSNRLNPYYLQGDFDGDAKLDLAVLVSAAANRKSGILVVFRDRPETVLVGAGVPLGAGGDDFSWMDAWSVRPRGPIEGAGAPPRLRGDALLVEKSESASALVYWDGKAFRWYQQGD